MSGDEEDTGRSWLWSTYEERDALAIKYLLEHGYGDVISILGLDQPASDRRSNFDAHTHYERGGGWRTKASDPAFAKSTSKRRTRGDK